MARDSERPRNQLAATLLREITEALREGGASIQGASRASRFQPDLLFERGGEQYVVELKVAPINRIEHLQALLAAATLQARKIAEELRVRALPMLGLERISDRTLIELTRYMQDVAPDQLWAVVDRHGRRHFSDGDLRDFDSQGRVLKRAERSARSAYDPLTDLGQWMAKILLAHRLPEAMLAAPRESVRNARHLAAVANVSAPTAARWVQHMRSEGFLEEREAGLRLVRRREFFDRWRRALARPRREVPARFVLPFGSANEQLNFVVGRRASEVTAPFDPDSPLPYPGAIVWKQRPRMCLAMFEAATAHGAAFVQGAPAHVYFDSVSDKTLATFELEHARTGERATLTAVEPRFPESTFRACVMAPRRGGAQAPVVDVLQTWLEVHDHPARGRELADEIERRVIGPWLLADDDRARAR